MNYAPQTQWIGGSYPGVTPPHLHRETAAPTPAPGPRLPRVGKVHKAIVAFACEHGPISATEVAIRMGLALKNVRRHLQTASSKTEVAEEKRFHANGVNRVMYYMRMY